MARDHDSDATEAEIETTLSVLRQLRDPEMPSYEYGDLTSAINQVERMDSSDDDSVSPNYGTLGGM